MRKSIATVCLSGSLADKLRAAARAGFDGVEIFENDLLASPLRPEEIGRRAADLGLGIDLYQPFRDFEAVPGPVLRDNLRRAEHKFAVMERLGARLLLVCSSVSPEAADDDDLAAEHLHLLAELAARHGIRIAYEALAWGRHVSDYRHAWRIVRAGGHPNLGLCLDSFHILSRGDDPQGIEGIERIPGEKIFFLQLADAPRLAMDPLQWSRHYRCFPGQGDFDLAGLVGSVLRAGYRGPLSLEVFNDVFRQAAAPRTALDARRSLLALEESLALEGLDDPLPEGRPASGSTVPAGTNSPAATAPPVRPTGFAFAELATPALRGELSVLLEALGFTLTGRHFGKPVELWEQGAARILLNTADPESAEGPALTAIGLESPDPDGSVRRAESLLAPVLPRRRVPHEVPLHAVAAPDGTELFFCRTARPDHPSWTADFAPPGQAPRDGPRHGAPHGEITHIDHVALTQPWHYFDEASLFYRSVLDLRPRESVELADPYGLLRSRAVATPDGAVRIALNVAYVGSHAGEPDPPWQHVALASRDIVATAQRLSAAGDLRLPIPGNYYDDLEARYDLGDKRHRQLRELGILYDRDEHGEFLHCYTISVGRVFFELVQRLGGYRAYGAVNAPIRLAVQHARPVRPGAAAPGR